MADRSQKTPLGPGVVDRGAYNFGGDPNAADALAKKLQGNADAAQGRQGEQIDGANSAQDRGLGMESRAQQVGMADLMRRRAMGLTPSIAGMRADQDMGRAAAAQSSAAASARGPAGMALAQQGAAANTAAAQSNISNNAQINSAVERQQAEQAAFSAASGIRGGDQQQQGQDFGQAAKQAELNAQQRAQNDAFTLGNQGQGIGVQGMQLGADMNRDAAEQAGHFNAAGLQEQKNAAHDSNVLGWASAAASTAATVAPMVASDERTKVPVRFGSGGAAPIDTGYGQSNEDVRSGYDTNSVTMAKMVAHRALDEQSMQSAKQASHDASVTGGPQAVDMNPGKRWDAEDLGLIQAKQRNGVDLTAHEESSKASLQHRAGQDAMAKSTENKGGDAAKAAAGNPNKPGADAAGAGWGAALGGVGKALGSMSAAARPHDSFHYQAPVTHALPAMPQQTYSDEDTKRVVPLSEEPGTERHYDRDVSKAKPGAVSGASLSGPTPKYSKGEPKVSMASYMAARGAKKPSDADLQRMADEMLGTQKAQHAAALADGPSVGHHEAPERGSRADLVSGPSKWEVEWNRSHGNKSGSGMSDEQDGENNPQPYDDESTEARNGSGHGRTLALSDARTKNVEEHVMSGDRGRNAPVNRPAATGQNGDGSGYHKPDREESVEDREARHLAKSGAKPEGGSFDNIGASIRSGFDRVFSDERAKNVGNLGREMPRAEMAEAARSMRAVPYAYKDQFAAHEGQSHGEVNVGPVAQEMQKSPVAATAVKQDSPGGMRAIDLGKFTKVLGGVAASQQEQLDEQERKISLMARRLGGRR